MLKNIIAMIAFKFAVGIQDRIIALVTRTEVLQTTALVMTDNHKVIAQVHGCRITNRSQVITHTKVKVDEPWTIMPITVTCHQLQIIIIYLQADNRKFQAGKIGADVAGGWINIKGSQIYSCEEALSMSMLRAFEVGSSQQLM